MHKHAVSRITTAVDTALQITAAQRFSSFLLQLVTVIPPPPPPFPQPDGSICCVSIYFTPTASVVLPGRAQRPNTEIMQTAQQQNKHFDISPKGAFCWANQIPDSCLTQRWLKIKITFHSFHALRRDDSATFCESGLVYNSRIPEITKTLE